ncbi:MAG: hypothetical protein ACYDDS_18145 [Candidatus Sulfotelmatobacter sp.]
MRKSLLVLVVCAGMLGCNADTLGYVEKGKYDVLQKQLEKSEADLKTSQQQISECQAHKYQIYKSGWRTWRLDTVTGQTCILLTSESDWKKPETTAQGCF